MINVPVEDIMTENPIHVKESTSIGTVTHLLLRYQINGILVVKDDDPTKLLGIFTTTATTRKSWKMIPSDSKSTFYYPDICSDGSKSTMKLHQTTHGRVGQFARVVGVIGPDLRVPNHRRCRGRENDQDRDGDEGLGQMTGHAESPPDLTS